MTWLRHIRRSATLVAILALAVNLAAAGLARASATGERDPVVTDAVLGLVVLCTSHTAASEEGEPAHPASGHCPLCTPLAGAVLPPPPFAVALRLAVLRRTSLPTLPSPTLARHIAAGGIASRAPPFPG
jgi:hypothetical protein